MEKVKKKTKKCRDCLERKNVTGFKKSRTIKDGYVSICNDCISKNRKAKKSLPSNRKYRYFLYRLLNKEDKVLYVGQTTNMHNRIAAHIDSQLTLKHPEKFELYYNTHKIDYCEVDSNYHMNIYEIHYICIHKTPFNIYLKSENNELFDLPPLVWKPYILNSYIEDSSMYYYRKFQMSVKDIKLKLLNDVEFYNEFMGEYLTSNRIHMTLNPDFYEFNGETGEYDYFSGEDEPVDEEEENDIEN